MRLPATSSSTSTYPTWPPPKRSTWPRLIAHRSSARYRRGGTGRWANTAHLLQNEAGSAATEDGDVRDYERHWTPLHLDWVVEDIDAALMRAVAAGAMLEQPVRERRWAVSPCWPIRSGTASA